MRKKLKMLSWEFAENLECEWSKSVTKNGSDGQSWTADPSVMNAVLSPTELRRLTEKSSVILIKGAQYVNIISPI